jgi:hypothetical protein
MGVDRLLTERDSNQSARAARYDDIACVSSISAQAADGVVMSAAYR